MGPGDSPQEKAPYPYLCEQAIKDRFSQILIKQTKFHFRKPPMPGQSQPAPIDHFQNPFVTDL